MSDLIDTAGGLPEGDEEIVGFPAAAKYVGIAKGTFSSYKANGYGPRDRGRRVVGQYNQYVFWKSDLDHWLKNRPGRGARTDRRHVGVGSGKPCPVCPQACTVVLT